MSSIGTLAGNLVGTTLLFYPVQIISMLVFNPPPEFPPTFAMSVSVISASIAMLIGSMAKETGAPWVRGLAEGLHYKLWTLAIALDFVYTFIRYQPVFGNHWWTAFTWMDVPVSLVVATLLVLGIDMIRHEPQPKKAQHIRAAQRRKQMF